jgi:hypothetical protein
LPRKRKRERIKGINKKEKIWLGFKKSLISKKSRKIKV